MSVNGVNGAGGANLDVIVSDKKDNGVSVDDFLNLMVTQLANQDFMNPVDDTQYLTQLAQFASMQSMQELSYYSQTNYVMSMIGKEATVAKLSLGGNVTQDTGIVSKVSLVDNEFLVYVNDKSYTLDQIMTIQAPKKSSEAEDGDDKEEEEQIARSLSVATVTRGSAEIRWTKATSEEDSSLRYSVYYSTSSDFDSVDEVKKGKLFGTGERENLFREIITGLESDTVYYVNIVATDEKGNESVYDKVMFTTKGE